MHGNLYGYLEMISLEGFDTYFHCFL